jgi:pSer/pThr/pTyr-binding forkhead associated (FHA) protein
VKIYATTQGWYAEDLGSTNGTLLDDAALRPGSPQPMRTGAVLTVGRTTLELRG